MYQDKVNNHKPIEVELEEGTYCYYNIAEKWNAMLCDSETAAWGARLIINLLNLVDGLKDKDDTMEIYQTPEWKELVEKCGPVLSKNSFVLN